MKLEQACEKCGLTRAEYQRKDGVGPRCINGTPHLWPHPQPPEVEDVGGEEPFAEIDADEFEAAKENPGIQAFVRAADDHLAQLCADGRIDVEVGGEDWPAVWVNIDPEGDLYLTYPDPKGISDARRYVPASLAAGGNK
jgi:hypothetical protein